MGLFGEKGYLRVLTPQTIDGTTLRYTEDGQRVIKKETHLPLTSRKFLEQENESLPTHLKHIIEEVKAEAPQKSKQPMSDGAWNNPSPKEVFDAKNNEGDENTTSGDQGEAASDKPARAKPGPKPKEKVA